MNRYSKKFKLAKDKRLTNEQIRDWNDYNDAVFEYLTGHLESFDFEHIDQYREEIRRVFGLAMGAEIESFSMADDFLSSVLYAGERRLFRLIAKLTGWPIEAFDVAEAIDVGDVGFHKGESTLDIFLYGVGCLQVKFFPTEEST